jgi:hypothetical protein
LILFLLFFFLAGLKKKKNNNKIQRNYGNLSAIRNPRTSFAASSREGYSSIEEQKEERERERTEIQRQIKNLTRSNHHSCII